MVIQLWREPRRRSGRIESRCDERGSAPLQARSWSGACIPVVDEVHLGMDKEGTMGRQTAVVLYVLALVAVVVGLDILFFRHQFWERLMANVGVVLVFTAFYLRFLKRP